MFDGRAFRTWPLILIGATAFAGLFMLLAAMSGLVLESRTYLPRAVVGLGVGAFIGYVATAWLIRPSDPPRR